MNRRLLTSAVIIHATACLIAFLAVGPGQNGANASDGLNSFMPLDSLSHSTQSLDESPLQEELTEEEWARSLPALETPQLPEFELQDANVSENHSVELKSAAQ